MSMHRFVALILGSQCSVNVVILASRRVRSVVSALYTAADEFEFPLVRSVATTASDEFFNIFISARDDLQMSMRPSNDADDLDTTGPSEYNSLEYASSSLTTTVTTTTDESEPQVSVTVIMSIFCWSLLLS